MTNYQFKTNINCSGCIEKVTPVLNNMKTVSSWTVDTLDPKKILQVQGERGIEEEIIHALQAVGYKAAPLSQAS